jgi:hypothetical protein
MTTGNADFIAQLRQIEELAVEVHGELPEREMRLKTRVQHIIVLAKTLRGRLELGGVTLVPVEPLGEPKKPALDSSQES